MKTLRIGLLGLVAVAAVALCNASVEGGYIKLNSEWPGLSESQYPDVFVRHEEGAAEGYEEDFDSQYSVSPPAIDFYSMIAGYNLTTDSRGLDSTSTYHTKMIANGITGTENGTMSFIMGEGNDFGTLPIYSDIFDKAGSLLLGNIDVRQYAQNGTTVPLSLADGDYYNIDVRFTATPEPSSLTLLGIAAGLMAFGWWRRGRFGGR